MTPLQSLVAELHALEQELARFKTRYGLLRDLFILTSTLHILRTGLVAGRMVGILTFLDI